MKPTLAARIRALRDMAVPVLREPYRGAFGTVSYRDTLSRDDPVPRP